MFSAFCVLMITCQPLNAQPQNGDQKDSVFTETLFGVSFDFIFVEGGTFNMGTPPELAGKKSDEILHSVTLSDYYIGETEVTIEQYLLFVDSTRSHYPEWLEVGNTYNILGTSPDKDYYRLKGMSLKNLDYPITGVSWFDAMAFCQWLSDETGHDYQLCTEAEWEYAARGGNRSKGYTYSGSDSIKEVAWYYDVSYNTSHPVKQLKPNELGIYDMSGNVWEWCLDLYAEYPTRPETDPQGPAEGLFRVDRGGAWSTLPERCRVAYRLDDGPELRDFNVGFRVCRILDK
jgi:formylglycine-generating enzyme required for sulfatase activity